MSNQAVYETLCREETKLLQRRNIARGVLVVGAMVTSVGLASETHQNGWSVLASIVLLIVIQAGFLCLLTYQDHRFRQSLQRVRESKALFSTLSAKDAVRIIEESQGEK